jgi:HlyD family secretion protein
MLRALRNEDLVKSLCAGGAPIVVTIALSPDRATPSGYRWSSGSGPPIAIQSGTICSAAVVIRKQTPASLVLPFLKKHLLGTGDSHVETGN